MTRYDNAHPALDPDLAAVLDELVLSADDDAQPFIATTGTLWRAAAESASLRYHEWALVDGARYVELKRLLDEARRLAFWKKRDDAAASRKRRRMARADREGRDYKQRANLRDMTAEDQKARRCEQNRVNQQLSRERKKGPSITSHPLFGRLT